MLPSKEFTGSSGNQENGSSTLAEVNPVDVVKRGFRILAEGGFRKISPARGGAIEMKSIPQQHEEETEAAGVGGYRRKRGPATRGGRMSLLFLQPEALVSVDGLSGVSLSGRRDCTVITPA
jgi:hypothetical protein